MIVVMTTVDDTDKAYSLAKRMVELKLAACVSICSIESTYFWEGKIFECQREFMMLIKTSEGKIDALLDWLQKNHPYDTPEIITIDARAYGKYVKWLYGYLESEI